MWLFTTEGFFSAVSDRNDEGTTIVRSVCAMMRRGCRCGRRGQVIETRDSDYRFRVGLPRAAWVADAAAAAEATDYSNFKAAVAYDRAPIAGTPTPTCGL